MGDSVGRKESARLGRGRDSKQQTTLPEAGGEITALKMAKKSSVPSWADAVEPQRAGSRGGGSAASGVHLFGAHMQARHGGVQ